MPAWLEGGTTKKTCFYMLTAVEKKTREAKEGSGQEICDHLCFALHWQEVIYMLVKNFKTSLRLLPLNLEYHFSLENF